MTDNASSSRIARPSPLALCIRIRICIALALALGSNMWAGTPAHAQPSAAAAKAPIAHAWIDLATNASDIPGMGAAGGFAGGGIGGGLSGLFGGKSGGGNVFGNTRTAFSPGKFMDVAVMTRNNASLNNATQNIPAGVNLGPSLPLAAPTEKYDPPIREDEPIEPTYERPKGRMMLYWGCGDTIRPGQPRVLDAANASIADMQKFFGTVRTSTTRGARAAIGNPAWPNKQDDRKVPDAASLVGEHKFIGSGIPESFKVNLGNTQDFLANLVISQSSADGVTKLNWPSLNHARGYFLSALGSGSTGGDSNDMVIWTSSEVAELGFGLVDYQTNAAVDRWVRERVVLPSSATACNVPKGIFPNGGAMLRAIAYGSESYFSYPPRPTDSKALAAWQPEWSAKVRVKSTFMSMLGGMEGMARDGRAERTRSEEKKDSKPNPVDLLKGIFGR
jgi:hypothetical protein